MGEFCEMKEYLMDKVFDFLLRVVVLLNLPFFLVWAVCCGLASGLKWTFKRVCRGVMLEIREAWKYLKWGLKADKKQREKMLEGLLRNTQLEKGDD